MTTPIPLPCPFCGCSPIIDSGKPDNRRTCWATISCGSHALMQAHRHRTKRAAVVDAINNWNTRVKP